MHVLAAGLQNVTQLVCARLNADATAIALVAVTLKIVWSIKVKRFAQEIATDSAASEFKGSGLRKTVLGQNDHIPDILILRVLEQEADVHGRPRAGDSTEA